jgi:hypothetical protein
MNVIHDLLKERILQLSGVIRFRLANNPKLASLSEKNVVPENIAKEQIDMLSSTHGNELGKPGI